MKPTCLNPERNEGHKMKYQNVIKVNMTSGEALRFFVGSAMSENCCLCCAFNTGGPFCVG